jgi:alkyl sulfatase BDS1-like metallo-beta-lactamase superfamily hydrolase
MAALELENKLDPKAPGALIGRNPAAVQRLLSSVLPPEAVIAALSARLDPKKAADTHLTVAFKFTDLDKACALEIRRGVAEFHEQLPAKCDVVLKGSREALMSALVGAVPFPRALATGQVTVEGNVTELLRFRQCFETLALERPKFVDR